MAALLPNCPKPFLLWGSAESLSVARLAVATVDHYIQPARHASRSRAYTNPTFSDHVELGVENEAKVAGAGSFSSPASPPRPCQSVRWAS